MPTDQSGMPDSGGPSQRTPPYVPRIRIALWLILASMFVPLLSLILHRGTAAVVPSLILIVVAIVLLRLSRREAHEVRELMPALLVLCIASAAIGVAAAAPVQTMLLLVLITMVSATLVPCDLRSQLITVGIAVFALIFTITFIEGGFAAFGYGRFVGAPLHARGRMVGALLAANTVGRPRFDHGQIQLLEGIARQVAHYREAAHPFAREQERIARGIGHLASMGL